MTTTEADPRLLHHELADGDVVDLWTYEDDDRVSVTAWDSHGNLVGLAYFDRTPFGHPRHAHVEVTPTHRRRGMGEQLLRRLIAAASDRGIGTLTWTEPADDLAVRRLAHASNAVCARRVDHGRATSTIFVFAA